MNTIRQAKVNVKDRISYFKETNAPLLAVKRGRKRTDSSECISPSSDAGEINLHSQPVQVVSYTS